MLAVKAKHTAKMTALKEEESAKVEYLKTLVERLQREKDNLWAENVRKSRIIDQLVELQKEHFTKE
jgi:hypothetical protein